MNAIGYLRISVKDQSTYSLEAQERNVRQYCATHNLTLLNVFTDDGESSYTFDRPDWKSLEKFIRKNKAVDYLIIADHDRFSRNLAEALMKIKELHERYGIRVLATTDSFDTDFTDPSSFMVRAFKYMMAESELHKIRSRTQQGIHQACMKGYYVNKAPWGYVNHTIDGNPSLIPDPDKAYAVRMMFDEFTSGASIETVKKLIKAHGFNLKGNSAVQRILMNPTYAGLVKVPEFKNRPATTVKGIHEAIVPEHIFYKAAELLQEKERTVVHSNSEVPLKGVLKGPAGRLMSAGNSRGKSGKHYWYYVQQEDYKHFSAIKVHNQLDEILNILSFSRERIAMYEKIIGAEIQKHLMTRAESVAIAKKTLNQVEGKIARAEEKWLTEATSQASYTKVMTQLQSQRGELIQRLQKLQEDGKVYWQKLDQVLPKLYDIRSIYSAMPLHTKHKFLKMVFGENLMCTRTGFRTPFLHPMFSHNELILKEKGLLIVEQPSAILAEKTPSTAYGSLFEHFFAICDLLAA
jgi:site-specific DNA recombinase